MSTPKSKSKYLRDANGTYRVVYESNVDACQYFIHELTRAALRDVGKYLKRLFKDNYYRHFSKNTGDAGKITRYDVISSAKTEHPRLRIGLKTGRNDGFYAYFQEFGTSKENAYHVIVPKLGILTHAAEDNVAEIIKIESQYLSGLSDEAARLESLISEEEYDDDE